MSDVWLVWGQGPLLACVVGVKPEALMGVGSGWCESVWGELLCGGWERVCVLGGLEEVEVLVELVVVVEEGVGVIGGGSRKKGGK